jgi:hypothetical protein
VLDYCLELGRNEAAQLFDRRIPIEEKRIEIRDPNMSSVRPFASS